MPTRSGGEHLQKAADLEQRGWVYVGPCKRKCGWGTGVKTSLTTLCTAFLHALEQAVTVDKKRILFNICLQTFRKVSLGVHANGAQETEVKVYISRYYGLDYKRLRNGKEKHVVSHPMDQAGRQLLQRVSDDGMWSVKSCGAGKQREDVLDSSNDVWERSVKYFRWDVVKHGKVLK